MNKLLWLGMITGFCFYACISTKSIQQQISSQAASIINKAIEAHGGDAYQNSAFEFDFRNKKYTFKNNNEAYQYTRQETKEGIVIKDLLSNEGYTRHLDGRLTTLSLEDNVKYSNSLNSVIYFALLPYKLNDPAVMKKDKGLTTIKGKSYHTIEISFNQAGGGKDFEDVFYYWINKDSYIVDYLAYNYHVNNGGVRFREAIDSKMINGIRFQNYANYKADKNTLLADLPALFEAGDLKKLSVIELENIRSLAK